MENTEHHLRSNVGVSQKLNIAVSVLDRIDPEKNYRGKVRPYHISRLTGRNASSGMVYIMAFPQYDPSKILGLVVCDEDHVYTANIYDHAGKVAGPLLSGVRTWAESRNIGRLEVMASALDVISKYDRKRLDEDSDSGYCGTTYMYRPLRDVSKRQIAETPLVTQ